LLWSALLLFFIKGQKKNASEDASTSSNDSSLQVESPADELVPEQVDGMAA